MLFRNASALQQPEHFGTSEKRRKKKNPAGQFPTTIGLFLDGNVGTVGRENLTARAIGGWIPEVCVANVAKHTIARSADIHPRDRSRKIGARNCKVPVGETRGW